MTDGRVVVSDIEIKLDMRDVYLMEERSWVLGWDPSMRSYRVMGHGPGPEHTTVYLHNAIMDPPEGYTVDFVNRDTLDLTRDNLRLANRFQQALNRGPYKGRKYKGVSLSSKKTAYVARAGLQGKVFNIGSYPTEDLAAEAYDQYVVDNYKDKEADPVSGEYLPFIVLNFQEKMDEYLSKNQE